MRRNERDKRGSPTFLPAFSLLFIRKGRKKVGGRWSSAHWSSTFQANRKPNITKGFYMLGSSELKTKGPFPVKPLSFVLCPFSCVFPPFPIHSLRAPKQRWLLGFTRPRFFRPIAARPYSLSPFLRKACAPTLGPVRVLVLHPFAYATRKTKNKKDKR